MGYNWHWRVLLETEPGGSGTYLHYLIVGLGWTLATALAAWVIALIIGSLVGTIRTTNARWAVRLGNLYVEIFRNIPLIVQMFLWFFVVPELLPKALGDWIKQMPPPWGSYIPAVLCLAIFTSVRVAEQVKAGIMSLPRGQGMAGTAIGLTAILVSSCAKKDFAPLAGLGIVAAGFPVYWIWKRKYNAPQSGRTT